MIRTSEILCNKPCSFQFLSLEIVNLLKNKTRSFCICIEMVSACRFRIKIFVVRMRVVNFIENVSCLRLWTFLSKRHFSIHVTVRR